MTFSREIRDQVMQSAEEHISETYEQLLIRVMSREIDRLNREIDRLEEESGRAAGSRAGDHGRGRGRE